MTSHQDQDDSLLLQALRRRDEGAFVSLVERYQSALFRIALIHARTRAVAEEIVQDTWLGVLQGLDAFQARSTFKTWLFTILVNRARTRAKREGRTVPFSELAQVAGEVEEPAVAAERFLAADHPQWPLHWAVPPRQWRNSPDEQLLTREILALIERSVAELPAAQRQVIALRDLEGWTADEVCNVLKITETNQRVLLHRARSRVRGQLERYFEEP